jgi:hypothetical protein
MTERRVRTSIQSHKRTIQPLLPVVIASLLVLGASASRAHAAGIVTHAWMGLEAIDRVTPPELHALLDAHRDQVRAGAEFPDGGYATRSLGTPGGDYGEEAHWQRFYDAYVQQIRNNPNCGDLTDPNGPCAPEIAHLLGMAAHGMGDEVWDWLFEPNGPGFGESYLPPALAAFVGPGGLEAQFDIVAIARFARPIGPTPVIPDSAKIGAAFVAINRADIDPAAFNVGETFLDAERAVEAGWAPQHIDALERAMPWTRAHLVSAAGGVDFGATAVAGSYETLWGQLLGDVPATRVSAMAPFDGQTNVPATGWTGGYSPGSNAGNSGGLTRIAAALTSALPYRPLAGFGSLPGELPVDALRLRDLDTGLLVARKGGYPRIVPYNPEAGEHVVAFQPAADLAPCRWYQVETTELLVDARQNPVTPKTWRFQTSGCGRRVVPTALEGTLVCDASGTVRFLSRLNGIAPRAHGRITLQLAGCKGGANGAQRAGSSLPITGGSATFEVGLSGSSCADLDGTARLRGKVRWTDAQGKVVGLSAVRDDTVDLRGDVTTTARRARAFPSHALALRIAPDLTGCSAGSTTLTIAGGKVTAWPE